MTEYKRVREQALLTDEELRQRVAEYATVGFTSISYEGLMKLLPLIAQAQLDKACLLYTSPSPRDRQRSRMPSSA